MPPVPDEMRKQPTEAGLRDELARQVGLHGKALGKRRREQIQQYPPIRSLYQVLFTTSTSAAT